MNRRLIKLNAGVDIAGGAVHCNGRPQASGRRNRQVCDRTSSFHIMRSAHDRALKPNRLGTTVLIVIGVVQARIFQQRGTTCRVDAKRS